MKKILILIYIFLFTSCASNEYPDDPLDYFNDDPVELKVTRVVLSNDELGQPTWWYMYDHPMLITFDSKFMQGKCLNLIDLDKQEARKYLTLGRGPCEFSQPIGVSLNANHMEFKFFDNVTREFYKVFLDSAIELGSDYCPQKIDLPLNNTMETRFFSLKEIYDEQYLAYFNEKSDSMYTIYDFKNEIRKDYLPFPTYNDKKEEKQKVAKKLYTGELSISPNKERAAVISQPTLIDILAIDSMYLERVKTIQFYRYKFRISNGNPRTSQFNIKYGFMMGDVTDEYIYVHYDGVTEKEKRKNGLSGKYLLVFDWKGNPVKSFYLSRHILGFVAKRDNSGIYAMVDDQDGTDLVEYNFLL